MLDEILWQAMEEVDRLFPDTPKIAPPRPSLPMPKPKRYIGVKTVFGNYVVEYHAQQACCKLDNGKWVTLEWLDMHTDFRYL